MVNRWLKAHCGHSALQLRQGVHILINGADACLQALQVVCWLIPRCRLPNFAHVLDNKGRSVLLALQLYLVGDLNGTPLVQSVLKIWESGIVWYPTVFLGPFGSVRSAAGSALLSFPRSTDP